MADPPLPKILAGPILRRTDENGAWVWMATSTAVEVVAKAYDAASSLAGPGGIKQLATGTASSLPFGAALHVVVVGMMPPTGTALPVGKLLAYNIQVTPASGSPFQLDQVDELTGADRITYPPYSLPTFFVPAPTSVNLLHGSCRMAHGFDDDALTAADTLIAAHVDDLALRPSALFLTGDQMYADDVADALAGPVRELERRLLGFGEKAPWLDPPDEDPILFLTDGKRGTLLTKVFTPDDAFDVKKSTARNHLIGFGEFAAMQLLAWNRALWAPDAGTTDRDVRAFRAGLTGVRRALANIPTYMMLDDHEVTDDWNRTKAWQARAEASPLGRRVIANGLVAFWAFQGWGNDPGPTAPRPAFVTEASTFLSGGGTTGAAASYEKAALDFRDFSFVAPTHPRAVVVDMRTTRGPDPGTRVDGKVPDPESPCEILGQKGLDAFVARAKSACKPGQLLVVVAPAPVVGFAPWERAQELLAETGIRTADRLDLESWHANPASYHRLLVAIAEQVQPGACLFLSGDVHFGHVAKAVLTAKAEPGKAARHLGFTQFTSSALKNRHTTGKLAGLRILDTFVPDIPPEWVWRPKASGGSLPKVRPAVQAEYARAVAENGRLPDYTHRSYGVGATTCSVSPLLITGSNLGQLVMADAEPATLARFAFLGPDAKAIVERELHLDWRSSLRPRQQ